MDEVTWIVIIVASLAVVLGYMVIIPNVDKQNYAMGSMICHKQYGDDAEFIRYDLATDTAICTNVEKKPFDGSYTSLLGSAR